VNRFIGYSPVVTTISYSTLKITENVTHKATSSTSIVTVYVRVVPETCMMCCLAKWVVPCLAPIFRLLGGVYRAVAWQWSPGSDPIIVAFRRHVTILYSKSISTEYIVIFWFMTPCNLVYGQLLFGGTRCLHSQG
jgi:hypothetical protein